jgi:hypothetical protein
MWLRTLTTWLIAFTLCMVGAILVYSWVLHAMPVAP